MPNMEELKSRISRKISEEKRRDMDNKIRLRLRIWPDEIGRRNGKPMHIHRYRRIHWIIPFFERVLRDGRYTNYLPGSDRQNIRI